MYETHKNFKLNSFQINYHQHDYLIPNITRKQKAISFHSMTNLSQGKNRIEKAAGSHIKSTLLNGELFFYLFMFRNFHKGTVNDFLVSFNVFIHALVPIKKRVRIWGVQKKGKLRMITGVLLLTQITTFCDAHLSEAWVHVVEVVHINFIVFIFSLAIHEEVFFEQMSLLSCTTGNLPVILLQFFQ